ncbi:hypothetical protein [Aeromicrobium sp. UC242_57]|uniref:hypothetical protein n=1 Tax=Aeromicrobium sp. UC242_57 TaxID=3374624 RepID=UPI0037B8B0B6
MTYFAVGPDLTRRPVSVALSPSGSALYVSSTTSSGPTTSKITSLSTSTGAVLHESAPLQNASSVLTVAPSGSVWVAGDTPRVLDADLASAQATPGVPSGRAGRLSSPRTARRPTSVSPTRSPSSTHRR